MGEIHQGLATMTTAKMIIRSGLVVDGTGTPAFIGDVAIGADGKILAVGPSPLTMPADEEFDATGKVVAPGWIDPHTHFDAQWSEKTFSDS